MPWYSVLNFFGLLIAAGYGGFVTTATRTPFAAYTSASLFLIAFILPVAAEYRRLNTGFREIETTYRTNRQRESSPPKQEIITPNTPRPKTAPPRHPPPRRPFKSALMLGVIACSLLGYDILDLIINAPPSLGPDDTLTNF